MDGNVVEWILELFDEIKEPTTVERIELYSLLAHAIALSG